LSLGKNGDKSLNQILIFFFFFSDDLSLKEPNSSQDKPAETKSMALVATMTSTAEVDEPNEKSGQQGQF
jgi:hypothetical protein